MVPAPGLSPGNPQWDRYRWGGTLEYRVRVRCKICRAICSSAGDDYQVILEISAADGSPGGLGYEDSRKAAGSLYEKRVWYTRNQAGATGHKVLRNGTAEPDQFYRPGGILTGMVPEY
jgi:2,4-dienoyl-CoA reductase-like NADH-dependent reductase (Old Yellow Enzyme family)